MEEETGSYTAGSLSIVASSLPKGLVEAEGGGEDALSRMLPLTIIPDIMSSILSSEPKRTSRDLSAEFTTSCRGEVSALLLALLLLLQLPPAARLRLFVSSNTVGCRDRPLDGMPVRRGDSSGEESTVSMLALCPDSLHIVSVTDESLSSSLPEI